MKPELTDLEKKVKKVLTWVIVLAGIPILLCLAVEVALPDCNWLDTTC